MPCQAIRSLGWVEALLFDDLRTELAQVAPKAERDQVVSRAWIIRGHGLSGG